MAIWVSLGAGTLAILNTIFGIWRWRADRTFVAWVHELKATSVAPDADIVRFTNQGTSAAFNVVFSYAMRDADAGPWTEWYGTNPAVRDGTSREVVLMTPMLDVKALRVEWNPRPGRGRRQVQTWDPHTGEDLRQTIRFRIGRRVGSAFAGRQLDRKPPTY